MRPDIAIVYGATHSPEAARRPPTPGAVLDSAWAQISSAARAADREEVQMALLSALEAVERTRVVFRILAITDAYRYDAEDLGGIHDKNHGLDATVALHLTWNRIRVLQGAVDREELAIALQGALATIEHLMREVEGRLQKPDEVRWGLLSTVELG